MNILKKIKQFMCCELDCTVNNPLPFLLWLLFGFIIIFGLTFLGYILSEVIK